MDRKTIPWWATASTSKKVGKRKSSSLRTPNILTAFLSLLSPSTCPLPKPLSFQSLLITYRRLPNDTDEKGRDNQHVLSTGIFLSPSSSTPSHPLQPLSSKPTLLRPFHSPRVFLFPNCRIPIPAQMDSTQSLKLEEPIIPLRAASRDKEPPETFPLEVLLHLVVLIYTALNIDFTSILLKLTLLCQPGNLTTFYLLIYYFYSLSLPTQCTF